MTPERQVPALGELRGHQATDDPFVDVHLIGVEGRHGVAHRPPVHPHRRLASSGLRRVDRVATGASRPAGQTVKTTLPNRSPAIIALKPSLASPIGSTRSMTGLAPVRSSI